MEKKIKTLEIVDKILIAGTIIVGIITVIDIFLPDPILLLDEAALTAITGLLTYISTLVRKKIDKLKNGSNEKTDMKDIEKLTDKVSETASSVKRSRGNKWKNYYY